MIDVREKDGGVVLSLRVQPRAARSEIVGEHGTALKIRIAAPPVDGAANEAIIKFLAAFFGVRRSQVTILAGATGPNKAVRIDGITKEAILKNLASLSR